MNDSETQLESRVILPQSHVMYDKGWFVGFHASTQPTGERSHFYQ
ncbi:MAG: hypothetical protein ACRDEA_04765 [Microcystaceae cyanobacterium]